MVKSKRLSCTKVRGIRVCFKKVPTVDGGKVVIAEFNAKGRGKVRLQGSTKALALKRVRRYDFI